MIAFLRNLVFEDFWLKLFSLVLAVLIWLTVTFASQKEGGTEDRVFSNLPVTVLASAEDVRNFKVSPREVEVTVRGDPQTLQSLQSKDIRATGGFNRSHSRTRPAKAHRRYPSRPVSPHLRVTPEEVQVIFPPSRR